MHRMDVVLALVALAGCSPVTDTGVDLTLEFDARIGSGGQASGLWRIEHDPEVASNVTSTALVAHGSFVDAGGQVEQLPSAVALDPDSPTTGGKFAVISPEGQAGGDYEVVVDAVLAANPTVLLDSATVPVEIVPFSMSVAEETPITWDGSKITGAIRIELDAPSEVDVGINYLVQAEGTGAVIPDFSANANMSPPLVSGSHVIPVSLPADDPGALPSGPHELRIVVTALSVRKELVVGGLSF